MSKDSTQCTIQELADLLVFAHGLIDQYVPIHLKQDKYIAPRIDRIKDGYLVAYGLKEKTK